MPKQLEQPKGAKRKAMEVAALGLKVETQGVEGANKALDRLVEVAARAEKAVSGLEAAADSAGKKTRDLDKGASGAAEATRELDKGASDAAKSTKELDKGASDAAKSTTELDKGATGAAKATDALDKGAGKADKSTKGMGESADKATAKVDEMGKKAASTERGVSSFASAALKAGAVIAAAFSVSAIARYADAWSDMQSKVGAATKDMEGAAGMMTRLVDIANASYSPLEQTVSTYSRNVSVLRDLGKSSAQAADYVESLNNMLVLTATRGERAASVQDALSKAMATGKLEADGLETVLANGGEVAAALARQLNTTTSGLRAVASQGKITGKVIAEAMISSLDDVRKRAAEMPATITDAFVILTNNVTEFVGRLDKASGASATIAGVIIDFAGWLRKAGDYAIALGALLAPAFEKIGGVLKIVVDNAAIAGVALAGFFAPTVIGGIASLTVAIGVGLVGAVKAVTAAMLANPIGLLVAAIATAGYVIYKFRDDLKQALGFDVAEAAKTGANIVIGSFVAAYEDIKFVWSNFGDIIGGAVVGAANISVRATNGMIQSAISGVNSLVDAINKIPGINIDQIGKSVGISEIDNPYAERLSAAVDQRNAAVQAAMSRDYLGDIANWVSGVGAKAGSGGGDGGAGKPVGGKGGASVSIEAETAAIKRALADQVGALEAAMEKNEYLYGLGLRQAKEYYDTKGALGRDVGLAEAAAVEQEISVINKALAANKLTEDQRKKLLEDRRKLVNDLAMATVKALSAEIAAEEAAARKRTSLQQDMTKSAQAATTAAADQAAALALQVEQYGWTATAIAKANVARAEEDLAIAQTTRAMYIMRGERAEDIELIDKEIEAIRLRALALRSAEGSTAQLEILEKNKAFAEEAKKQNELIGESLTDALMRGFEDGAGFAENFKKTLVNLFKTMVLKPIIQPIAQGAASYVTNALGLTGSAGSAAGGQSLMGTASNLSSLYGAVTGDSMIGRGLSAIGSYFGGGGAAAAAFGATGGFAGLGASTVAGTALGTGAFGAGAAGAGAITGIGSVTGAALGTTAATGIAATGTALGVGGSVGGAAAAGTAAGGAAGMGAAAMIPYIGWAIAAIAVLSTFIGSDKTPAVGNNALTQIGAAGTVAADEEDARAKFFGDDRGYTGPSAGLTTGMAALGDQIAATAKMYGGDATGLQLYAQTAQSPDGQGASGGTALYDAAGNQFFGSQFEGTNEELQANVELSMKRALLGGLKASNLAPEFAEVFKGYGENLGTLSDEQISSITAALEAVRAMNTAFDGLAITFPELEELGWEARTALTNFSGGLEAFSANLGSYYETYYTESERMGDTLSSMTQAFEGLGLAVPGTKDEFRSLMESLDLTTESGQKAYATLLGMNQTFAGWADYAEAGAKAITEALQSNENSYAKGYFTEAERNAKSMEEMRAAFIGLGLAVPYTREGFRALVESLDVTTEAGKKARATLLAVGDDFGSFADRITAIVTRARELAETEADNAMSGLTRAVSAQKDALTKAWQDQQKVLQDGIDTAAAALANHQALSQRVKSTLASLFGQSELGMQRIVAQGQLTEALTTARAGGGLPDAASLESAFGVISQPSQQLFRTFEEYQLDFLKTANDIAELGQLTDSQISIEERTLNVLKQQLIDAGQAYKDQIEYYDNMLTMAQAQLDAALGNTQATLTVAQAMTAFSASLASLIVSQANKPPSSNGAPAGLSSGEQVVWDAYQGSGIGNLDAGGWQFWNEAIRNGADPSAIAAEIAAINAGKVNGSHANGLDRVPFNGYIAELHEGERVKTKSQARAEDMERAQQARSTGMMSDGASLMVLQQLLARVTDMSAETKAIAQNTGRWIRLADRWDGDGLPATRDEME